MFMRVFTIILCGLFAILGTYILKKRIISKHPLVNIQSLLEWIPHGNSGLIRHDFRDTKSI